MIRLAPIGIETACDTHITGNTTFVSVMVTLSSKECRYDVM